MAIIKCDECGKDYSDKANSCPNCGCPTTINVAKVNQKSEHKSEPSISYEASESAEDTNVGGVKIKSIVNAKNISILIIVLLVSIIGIYIYDDQQREIDYRMRYEAAMDNYNDQMTLYNQCLSNLNDSNIKIGSIEHTMALFQCKNIKPNIPFIIRRDRIFKIPFID